MREIWTDKQESEPRGVNIPLGNDKSSFASNIGQQDTGA